MRKQSNTTVFDINAGALVVLTMTVAAAVGGNVGGLLAVIAYYRWHFSWAGVLFIFLLAVFLAGAIALVTTAVIIWQLQKLYGGNYQPRDDNGRYVPVYDHGELSGHIKPRGKRAK